VGSLSGAQFGLQRGGGEGPPEVPLDLWKRSVLRADGLPEHRRHERAERIERREYERQIRVVAPLCVPYP
jgi:hypothetical protein